ncbi:hypothetical protein AB0L35_27355 [Streptomyces sp. NPDC052309]|uniref:hypothetical protein n=1 Tax=Streptomyces sp. NPDC052309 TaxID=3155421 RepID=UPI003428393E
MSDEQYLRYRDDLEVLAAIGTQVAAQTDRVTVRLSGALAEAAVAAWQREETAEPGPEGAARYALRDAAAELALIGLAITERGRREGEEVVVDLDVASAGAAARAAE